MVTAVGFTHPPGTHHASPASAPTVCRVDPRNWLRTLETFQSHGVPPEPDIGEGHGQDLSLRRRLNPSRVLPIQCSLTQIKIRAWHWGSASG